MVSRGCKHPADVFCYVCGEFIKTRAKRYHVKSSLKKRETNNAYFGMPVGNETNFEHLISPANYAKELWKVRYTCSII